MRNGKLATIIFIRDRNARGQEVSGYIDYGHRLKTENMEPYFDKTRKKLMPKATDLSYYNWDSQISTSNPTPNFQVRRPVGCAARCRSRAGFALCRACCLATPCLVEIEPSCILPWPRVLLQVIADNEAGLLFKNKRDRKVINVDPRTRPGDNSTRTEVPCQDYMQVVLFDHVARRRN